MLKGGGGRLGAGALALVISSTAGTFLGKVLYEMEAPGRGGKVHSFEKPWASTLVMFCGMAACLPAAATACALNTCLGRIWPACGSRDTSQSTLFLQRLRRTSPNTPGSSASTVTSMLDGLTAPLLVDAAPGNDGADGAAGSTAGATTRALRLILVPTVFDLLATILLSVGLLHINASVYSMMRGSEIVFTALLSTAFLHRHLNRFHVAGIMLCTAGVTLVGAASIMDGAGRDATSAVHVVQKASSPGFWSAADALLGMALVLAAEGVQAAQVVVEDLFLHSLNVAPLTVVGFEGLFGMALMCIILPAVQWLPGQEGAGIHEDSLDTLAMLASSPNIRAAAAWLAVGMAVYNLAGMMATDDLGAVTRTVLETLKTLLVWTLNLLAFYASRKRLGEPWTPHSWLQAAGFAVLVGGTLLYAHGDEEQARRLRAKLRWARLRESLATLVSAPRVRQPLLAPRIAGPGRIRTAFLQPRAVAEAVSRLQELLRERRAAAERLWDCC